MRSSLRGPLPALLGCAACVAGVVALMFVAYYDAGVQRLDATALYGFTTLDAGLLHGVVWGFALIGGVFPLADWSRKVPVTFASVVGSGKSGTGESRLWHAASAIAPQSARRRRIGNLGRVRVEHQNRVGARV